MLQWMGGSMRKVATKQYFEQRKRKQQNLQMMGSDNCYDSPGISGQNPKEHRSLDILNLLNLSTKAQQCNLFCPEGKHRIFFLHNRSSPDHQNTAFNGPPNQWKTVTDQYSEFSVIDLVCDDEPNATAEKFPTCEDHVSFSLKGLGKVGTETPVHSPEQRFRIPYRYSPLQKDKSKSKLKKLNHELDDIELEVDTMVQDIKVSPISSSDFPFNKLRRSSAIVGNGNLFYDIDNRNGSSDREEFFYKTENSDGDLWNDIEKLFLRLLWNIAGSVFLDETFDNEMGYDTSCKQTFQMGSKSPELLKSGTYKMENYAFEDLLPKKWSSAIAMKEMDMREPRSSFSKDELEKDFDFYFPSRSRLDGNFNAQNFIPEDVRDNSSLLSEESSSCTAVRGESTAHSPAIMLTGENRRKHRNALASPRKHRNAFASPRKHRNAFSSSRNKYSTKDEKCRSMPNSSKRVPSHYSNCIPQEELGARNSWHLEERNPSLDKSSIAASFCLDLEADFAVFGSKKRNEDPFSVFSTLESNMASPSFGGFKKTAPPTDSPPCSFTSQKFAFDSSAAFPNVGSWPTSPSLSPDFHFRGKSAEGFHCATSSTDMSGGQGSVSKSERQVKLQKERHNFFDEENIFMGDDELSSEKKLTEDAPSSKNHEQECEGTEDTNPKASATECLVTADSSGHVEEISSLLKKPDKQESQVDKRKSNCDAETPLKCETSNEEKRLCLGEERKTSEKHNIDKISLSGQVMFESFVFQLLRVQKVLKEAST
ncbi:hypothetical protein ACSQ67_011990 [Phaseolus vulgaris]